MNVGKGCLLSLKMLVLLTITLIYTPFPNTLYCVIYLLVVDISYIRFHHPMYQVSINYQHSAKRLTIGTILQCNEVSNGYLRGELRMFSGTSL